MNEITYIFGAGASYQAMPLVANFSQRFNVYLSFLNDITSEKEFLEANNSFLLNVSEHLSFDTYFKKLFHQNEEHEIDKNKRILLYYLIFENLCPIGIYRGYARQQCLEKKFRNDPRYDSMIASLLLPLKGSRELFIKINLITWNYDLGLMTAIRNFLFSGTDIPTLIKKYNTRINVFEFSSQLTLIHLNGFVFHNNFNDLSKVEMHDLKILFASFVRSFKDRAKEDVKYNFNKLTFAWESGDPREKLSDSMKFSIDGINNSQSVIITGYSFPLYNRLYDQLLIDKEKLNRKNVFIRDPIPQT
jgi:hypothetical protein